MAGWLSLQGAAAPAGDVYHRFIRHDHYGIFGTLLFLIGAGLVVLLSQRYVARAGVDHPEYYGLTLFATCGMIVMAQSTDLLAFFIGLEILSLAFYALIGMSQATDSVEAALKYFLMGAFASGFYLMGSAFLFGAAQSTRFADLPAGASSPLAPIGAALVLGAVAFKLALPPFHMWAPDAYQGAPSSVTAFMAFGTKASVFFALLRISTLVGDGPGTWVSLAVILAVGAMVWGNTVALAQGNLRRLIAYSSISHAGTILLGVVAGREGATAVLFYLATYTFGVVGIFAVLVALSRQGQEVVLIKDLAGLSRRAPGLSALLALFLLSLAGFPPTAGFFGKFLVFRAAVGHHLVLPAALGALASAIGVFYYLYVVVTMYMKEPEGDGEKAVAAEATPSLALVLGIAFMGTLPLGVFPQHLLDLAQSAVASL